MRAIAERPPARPDPEVMYGQEARERREFDVLASVYLLRNDMARYGAVRPETWTRVYEEELTLVAEGLDAPLTTTFEQHYIDGELVASDGQSVGAMLANGRQVAMELAERDPRYAFHAYRSESDALEGEALKTMMATGEIGATTVSFSTYPEETARQYGKALVINKGYQPHRKLAFVRIYRKVDQQTMRATTVSFDNSNLGAFRKVAAELGVAIPNDATSEAFGRYRAYLQVEEADAPALERQIVAAYDAHLEALDGHAYRQGRKEAHSVNAWQFLDHQTDLVQFYIKQLEGLAMGTERSRQAAEQAKKQLTINFWAALKARFEAYKTNPRLRTKRATGNDVEAMHQLLLETEQAGATAARNFEELIACGGVMTAGTGPDGVASLLDVSFDQLFNTIMTGDGKESDELVWVDGYCRIQGCKTSPRKTKVAQCKVCKQCQQVFDAGKNPQELYMKERQERLRRTLVRKQQHQNIKTKPDHV